MSTSIAELTPQKTISFLSVDECVELTTLSRVTLWRLSRAGKFPPLHELSARRKAYLRSEVEAWLQDRVQVGA